MILEDATYEAFGYFPEDLTCGSHKPVIAMCEDCGEIRIVAKFTFFTLCTSCCRLGERNSNYGKPLSEEVRNKFCGSRKGKHHTEETKALMSIHAKERIGEKNPNWRGGTSFEPYCIKFNSAYKRKIREHFDNKCFLCYKTQAENGRKLDVHHVNYNKNCECDSTKCIYVPLCHSCHAKTNGNRDYWEKKIIELLDLQGGVSDFI